MILAIVGIILLLLVMLIAVRVGMNKSKTEEEMPSQIIHGSGIYSIIRRSPRENIGDVKPSQEEIRKYLSDKNVNISNEQQAFLLSSWNEQMEANISTIEKGDQEGVEFYYFKHKWPDHICEAKIKKGRFVTREQIFDNPQIIPPFHLGCGCNLHIYQGKEKLHDTTEIRSLPLFSNGSIIPLPDWKEIIPIEKSPGA